MILGAEMPKESDHEVEEHATPGVQSTENGERLKTSPSADAEAEVSDDDTKLGEEVQSAQHQILSLKDQLLRALAETENLRKRAD